MVLRVGRQPEKFEGLTRLRQLNLARTPITDHGLEAFQGLTQLRELNLARTILRTAVCGT